MVRILLGLIGLMVFVLPAPPARGAEFMTWSDTGGKAHTISIGGDGSVWVLSFNKVGTAGDSGLHRWDAKARMWRSHRIGGGVKLAVDPTGTPWLVNALGDISRWTGEGWDRLPGKAKAIAIGAKAVWMGALAGLAVALIFQLRGVLENRYGKQATRQPQFAGFKAEDLLYLMPLVSVAGALEWFLYAAAVGAPLAALLVLLAYLSTMRGAPVIPP